LEVERWEVCCVSRVNCASKHIEFTYFQQNLRELACLGVVRPLHRHRVVYLEVIMPLPRPLRPEDSLAAEVPPIPTPNLKTVCLVVLLRDPRIYLALHRPSRQHPLRAPLTLSLEEDW
jgi:hypothetical protein